MQILDLLPECLPHEEYLPTWITPDYLGLRRAVLVKLDCALGKVSFAGSFEVLFVEEQLRRYSLSVRRAGNIALTPNGAVTLLCV